MAEQVDRTPTKITRLAKGGALRRVLKVSDLFAIGYGDLGSSIYYALGITALYALGATPIALGLAGVVFVCTAMTYAELTSTFHESGGSASFARHAFNDLVSFIAGWGLLLDYIVTIAISAFAVGPYLSVFLPALKNPEWQIGFTSGLIAILFLLNFFGIRQSTRISLILVVITLLTQGIIIGIGAGTLFDLNFIIEHIQIGGPDPKWSPSWSEFWRGTSMAMVAYTGVESIAQLSAEAKVPSKTAPRAVKVTMFVLIAMYLGISLVALSAVSPQELSTTYLMDPLAGLVAHLPFGTTFLIPWVGLLAAILLFVASNAGMVGASRLAYNMGEYYQLPGYFYRVHAKFRTPFVALAVFALLAILVVVASRGRMAFLADLYNFGAMLGFFFAHLSLIVLRIKKPDLKRPVKLPLNIPLGRNRSLPISAIVGCLATASVWVLIVVTKSEGRYLGLAWMLFGVLMYLFYRRKKKMHPIGHMMVERVTVPESERFDVKNILVAIRGGEHTETVQMASEQAKLHGAKLTAITILEVPPSLPLDAALPFRVELLKETLKRAEAIARDFDIPIELKLIRSRSIEGGIFDVLKEGSYDLLVIGSLQLHPSHHKYGLGKITEHILRKAPCRVLLCSPARK